MIGNDVVDLALARKESNWRRSGYLQKIFTVNEQLLIKSSSDPELLVWEFWSRKEAAYKIYNRETGIRAFIPKELECFSRDNSENYVLCKGKYYFTRTVLQNDCLHSIAATNLAHFDLIVPLNKMQSIIKVDGIPYTNCDTNGELKAVSISHHGRYHEAITMG
jgi:phosphopantetheinyl transferase (holo-ACP synthase)